MRWVRAWSKQLTQKAKKCVCFAVHSCNAQLQGMIASHVAFLFVCCMQVLLEDAGGLAAYRRHSLLPQVVVALKKVL